MSSITDMSAKELMQTIGLHAKSAVRQMAQASTEKKNDALLAIAAKLLAAEKDILEANRVDVEAGRDKGLDKAMIDRLLLTHERIAQMAKGVEVIYSLDDPVGKKIASWERPNGLKISKVKVPLGVIGIIYESRPNVTIDAAALCLKAGNAVILRGGSESYHSSKAIHAAIIQGLHEVGLPEAAVQMIPSSDRALVGEMLALSDYIDVIIPRGGKGLIERVIRESRVPTLQHLDGNCHSYIHAEADLQKAIEVVTNAKLRRPGICGATESLVVDRAAIHTLLPDILQSLIEKGCEVRGDAEVQLIDQRVCDISDADYDTEYLDAIISVKIVDNLDEAIAFVNQHSSHHTDAIITEDDNAAQLFLDQVDSAIVMHNCSTQFADGGEFGMGAEIGIATGRLHARGPVGVEELTTYKFVVEGDGQTRPQG